MDLKEKILAREATLGVIGLGYVGLPLAVEKAKAGFHVIGFDVQKEKVDMVNSGHNYRWPTSGKPFRRQATSSLPASSGSGTNGWTSRR